MPAITHDGKGKPTFDGNPRVALFHRDGSVSFAHSSFPMTQWVWRHASRGDDVIFYSLDGSHPEPRIPATRMPTREDPDRMPQRIVEHAGQTVPVFEKGMRVLTRDGRPRSDLTGVKFIWGIIHHPLDVIRYGINADTPPMFGTNIDVGASRPFIKLESVMTTPKIDINNLFGTVPKVATPAISIPKINIPAIVVPQIKLSAVIAHGVSGLSPWFNFPAHQPRETGIYDIERVDGDGVISVLRALYDHGMFWDGEDNMHSIPADTVKRFRGLAAPM